MGSRNLVLAIVTLMLTIPLSAEKKHSGAPVEPTAGQWRTWTISSGKDYRVPPPPAPNETRAELRAMADLIGQNTDDINAQIAYWDAGSPAYRWMDLIEPAARGNADDGLRAPRLHLRQHGDVRRDDSRLGIEVFLQPGEAERTRSQSADCRGCAGQPVVSIRTRRGGAGRSRSAGVLFSKRGAELSGHRRSGRAVSRAGGRSVSK